MLANLTQNAEVEQYLRSFPPAQRQHCLELTMLLGVQTAKKRFPYGVTLEALSRAVEKQAQSDLLDPGAMLERLRKMKVEQPEESHDARPSKKSEPSDKRANRGDSKPASSKPPAEPLPARPKGDRKPSDSRSHKTPTEEHKERPSKKQEMPVERFMPVQPPSKLIYDDEEDDMDTKETRIKPYIPKSAPTRPSKDSSPISRPESKGKAMPPSTLVEPRTNLAYVGKLSPGLVQKPRPNPERNILKITDDFLADPFIALLSNQTSPKLKHGGEHR